MLILTEFLGVRYTEAEKNMLQEMSRQDGRTPSQTVRLLIENEARSRGLVAPERPVPEAEA